MARPAESAYACIVRQKPASISLDQAQHLRSLLEKALVTPRSLPSLSTVEEAAPARYSPAALFIFNLVS